MAFKHICMVKSVYGFFPFLLPSVSIQYKIVNLSPPPVTATSCVYISSNKQFDKNNNLPWMRSLKVNETEPCELDTVQV